jgi:hypothetical protein
MSSHMHKNGEQAGGDTALAEGLSFPAGNGSHFQRTVMG